MNRTNRERIVPVEKDRLMQTLKANRVEHEQIYIEAMDGYRRECVSLLESRCSQAVDILNAGAGAVDMHFSMSQPSHHLVEYDQAIAWLEWTTEDTIELTVQEFQQYVLDQWQWQHNFLLQNESYSASAILKRASFDF